MEKGFLDKYNEFVDNILLAFLMFMAIGGFVMLCLFIDIYFKNKQLEQLLIN